MPYGNLYSKTGCMTKRVDRKTTKRKKIALDSSGNKSDSDMDVTQSHYRADNEIATPHATNQDDQSDSSGSQDDNLCQDSTDPKKSTAELAADFGANPKTRSKMYQR